MKEEELWAQERLALKTSLEEVRLEALRFRSPMFTKGNCNSQLCHFSVFSCFIQNVGFVVFALIEINSEQP